MLIRKFMQYWFPVILWMVFIFWLSTDTFSSANTAQVIEKVFHWLFPWLSQLDLKLIHAITRKVAHVVEYFILGSLLFCAYRSDSSLTWHPKWTIWAIITIILYAVSDEFHQSFVPSRTASIVDVSIDVVGGILSQIAIMLWNKIWQPNNRVK